MSNVTYTPGRFVWHELMTNQPEAAAKFYSELIGWTVNVMDMGDFKYPILNAGETGVAGVMGLPPEAAGVPNHWLGYVSVPNVDEAVAATRANGGQVLHGPMDVPNVGRMATITDAQGAVIAVFKSANGDSPAPTSPQMMTFCWDELMTTDIEAATKFYGKLFAWSRSEMPGNPEMFMFKAPHGEVASMMKTPPGVPPSWMTYILVENLADSVAKAKSMGAQFMMENIQVPNIGTFSVMKDPQGSYVSLFQGMMKS